jgi:hypothetical protein
MNLDEDRAKTLIDQSRYKRSHDAPSDILNARQDAPKALVLNGEVVVSWPNRFGHRTPKRQAVLDMVDAPPSLGNSFSVINGKYGFKFKFHVQTVMSDRTSFQGDVVPDEEDPFFEGYHSIADDFRTLVRQTHVCV